MTTRSLLRLFVIVILCTNLLHTQNISEFVSVEPTVQTESFVFPQTHRFQKIIESGDLLTEGGTLPLTPDFAGYIPILGSSTNGYLSINSERPIGNVTILDINFNSLTNLWVKTASEAIDFSSVAGTSANCSGTVTPWNTVISSEERISTIDSNGDSYNDYGWNVEIDPANKVVLDKLWAMGNFKHENITIHSNQRTAYQGADSNPGYLYKFVADNAQDLTSGDLYVYKGSKNGNGDWILLQNDTPAERNSTLTQSDAVSATVFNGVEDVEIGPDGMVYFAVKNEDLVYRFQDSDPLTGTTAVLEPFVGNMNYDITHNNGVTSTSWGTGNDNLAFDNLGNLWVFQDGGKNYIWVIGNNHSQLNPNVRLFGIAPTGSEPTGITFTPDFKFLFMSIQHPNNANNANQVDAEGNEVDFNTGTVIVLALENNLGSTLGLNQIENRSYSLYPNPNWHNKLINVRGENINSIKIFTTNGQLLSSMKYKNLDNIELYVENLESGNYFLIINNYQMLKMVVKN
jgi:secreted PhoX family phosphatase